MRLAACWYPVTVFGKGKKLGVWFQGCSQKCKECISPEFWPYEGGVEISPVKLLDSLGDIIPDGLVISGGEPFDQPEDLQELVKKFHDRYGEDILIYTGYKLNELINKSSTIYRSIIGLTAVMIDGNYDLKRNTGRGLAGSSNQNIYVWKLKERYANLDGWERKTMCVLGNDGMLWMIGVPPR